MNESLKNTANDTLPSCLHCATKLSPGYALKWSSGLVPNPVTTPTDFPTACLFVFIKTDL